MTAYDFVHLAFLALDGEIKGKTKLQKVVYFLGLATRHEEDLGYRPHFYGPYSDEVAAAVERLKTLGFLEQTVSGIGVTDARGFEVARYDYRLNDSGRKMAEAKAHKLCEEWDKIKKVSEAMKPLLDQDYMKLSIAAKTWFMLEQKEGPAKLTDLKAMAPKFGWSVTVDQIEEAEKLLQQVRLSSTSDSA